MVQTLLATPAPPVYININTESQMLQVAAHLPGVLVSLSLDSSNDPCDSVGLAAVAGRCGGGGSCAGDGAGSGCCYWGWCGCIWGCSCWC